MFTDPEKALMVAVLVVTALQFAKFFVPLLNGWGAFAANGILSAVGLFVFFRAALTWHLLAIYALIGLAAAGIHGTATKLGEHPSPHDNPTPSGTPAQNYKRLEL